LGLCWVLLNPRLILVELSQFGKFPLKSQI